jgi:hypothetical protein
LQAQELVIADQPLEINYSVFVQGLLSKRQTTCSVPCDGLKLIIRQSDHPPVAFVVYGPAVAMLFKKNYRQYSEVVDLAAKLTALNVIDSIALCLYPARRLMRLYG